MFADSRTGDDSRAPFCAKVVFGSVEYCDKDTDYAFCVCAVSRTCRGRGVGGRTGMAADNEGASEVADRGNDDREVITSIPEPVVGSLVAENLGGVN